MSHGLHCICMEYSTVTMSDFSKLRNRFYGTYFVIYKHHRHKSCFICDK